jgi:MSHA biogenesis protein MshN
MDTSLRQIPSMAETAPPRSAGPVEKQVRGASSNEQAEAAYRKATAANRQGRNSEAVEALREALKADPRHVSARQLLLSLLVERKQLDEASALLREGLELLPQQSAWAMALARIEVEKGQLPQAWETLQRTLPQAENNADYRGFAGALLQRLQKPKEAIPHYQAAVRFKPAESRWWLGLGLALEADGRNAEAREAFQKAQAAGNLGAEGAALVEQKLR